jgi:hypothetical protein
MMQNSENGEYDRRLRLVSLTYEVLRDLKFPADATDSETLSLLSQEFLARTAAPAQPPVAHGDKPLFMFSVRAMGTLSRRSIH